MILSAPRSLTLLFALILVAACGSNTTSPQPTVGPTDRATSSPTSAAPATAQPTSGTAEPPTSGPTTPPTQPPASGEVGAFNVTLSAELLASGMDPLVLATNAGDASGLLYALGQTGVIYVVDSSGAVQEQPFLDIQERVRCCGEQGLLGLAFHPDYESNGRFFVNYTDTNGDTNISEFARSGGDRGFPTGDPASEKVLLHIDQPFDNHNGGMVAFGPDGYLYTGMGDGGSGGDPFGNGQSVTSLLGKMLRIDVNSGDPYGIPPGNPFADGSGAPEIWDYGLRNPWRWSFDRENGNLFIGDVGQNAVEEIDAKPAGTGGRNYGWNIMEGDVCFRTTPCSQDGLTAPVAVNHRENGECAITGGYVYRGTQHPDFVGAYVFSDFCAGTLWAFDADAAVSSGTAAVEQLGEAGFSVSSFGEDEAGELYVVSLEGEIYRLVVTPR